MKELFETVPSANEVRQGLDGETQRVVEDFARKVTHSIGRLSRESFTLQSNPEFSRLYHGIHGQKLRDAMQEKGWRVQLISDQRDGDYFQISMLNDNSWQPMRD